MNEQFRRWNLETTEIWQTAHSILHWWQEQGRQLAGAFIQESVAQHGKLLPGSDIDLCIVTPDEPDPTWFEERVVSPYTIELYSLAQSTFDDLDWVLAQPALPFNLCEGIVIADPFHLLANVQTCLTPQLCLQPFWHKRIATCLSQAQDAPHAQQQVLAALHYETPTQIAQRYRAASDLTQSVWDSIAALPPTS